MAALPVTAPNSAQFEPGTAVVQGGFMLFGNDVYYGTTAGVPTGGAGWAGPGSVITDYTNGKLYINTNTKASPTWTVVGTQT